jgi:hypothetical protein
MAESKAVKAVKKFQATPFNTSCFVCSSKARAGVAAPRVRPGRVAPARAYRSLNAVPVRIPPSLQGATNVVMDKEIAVFCCQTCAGVW